MATMATMGGGDLSASSSCEALLSGASIPTTSPTGEQLQAGRQHAVLKKKRRELSTEWRRRAEVQGRPYGVAEPQRTSGPRGGSFSAAVEVQPRRASLVQMVTARRPGKSATTSSPTDSSEESEPASPVRRSARPETANPFLDDTDEEETDDQGRRVVSFPLTLNVGAPEADLATGREPKPKRRLSDLFRGFGCKCT